MEKIQKLSNITAELIAQMQNLQQIANKLSKLIDECSNNCQDSDTLEEVPAGSSSRIIAFPLGIRPNREAAIEPRSWNPRRASEIERRMINACFPSGWLPAMPGKPLPDGFADYRPFLQRNGLILLSWDKRITEMGERYAAYWVTSAGVPRFYASKYLSPEDFPAARPDHKSYAAEDGIEFYGQEAPVYVVHVAPELMMNNPRHRELRLSHVQILKDQGSTVDFNYKYLLKTEKKKNRDMTRNNPEETNRHQAG